MIAMKTMIEKKNKINVHFKIKRIKIPDNTGHDDGLLQNFLEALGKE